MCRTQEVRRPLYFDSTTEYRAYDGCQRFIGTYKADREELWFTSTEALEPICMAPTQYAAREGGPGNGDYRIAEGRLEVRNVEGDVLLYVPLENSP